TATPHDAVDIMPLRVGKGREGAAAGESLKRPSGTRTRDTHIAQHRMLPIMALHPLRPGAVGLYGKGRCHDAGLVAALDAVVGESGQAATFDTGDATELQSIIEGVEQVVVTDDIAQTRRAQFFMIDHDTPEPAALRHMYVLDLGAAGRPCLQ